MVGKPNISLCIIDCFTQWSDHHWSDHSFFGTSQEAQIFRKPAGLPIFNLKKNSIGALYTYKVDENTSLGIPQWVPYFIPTKNPPKCSVTKKCQPSCQGKARSLIYRAIREFSSIHRLRDPFHLAVDMVFFTGVKVDGSPSSLLISIPWKSLPPF